MFITQLDISLENPVPTLNVLCGRAAQTGGLETAEINALLLSTTEV